MMERFIIFCLVLVFISTGLKCVSGLQCYACHDTGPDNSCEQYDTYLEASEAEMTSLIKNCTAPYDQVCYVEQYADRGNSVSHIRDCGDNSTYSFIGTQQDEKGAYKALKDLKANNNTRCVWDGLHQVCLSKCTTDLCNGPQFVDTGASVRVTGLYLMITWGIASLLL